MRWMWRRWGARLRRRETLGARPRVERLESRTTPSFGAAGGEFRVNTFSTGNQGFPRIAMDADGDSVVAWQSNGQDGSAYGVFARQYNSAGTALGGEFRVNSFTTGAQFAPVVATDAVGDFVVVWVSSGQDGSGYGIFGQRYNSAGAALGGEFRVNVVTTGDQSIPAVAMDAAGDFVVAWSSTDGSAYGVFARRYNAAGVPLGGEVAVNTTTANPQDTAAVAMDAAGDFVVTWRSSGQDGSGDGVYARAFDALGNPVSGEVAVNQFTTGIQNSPAVAMDAAGNFVVAWQSVGQDGNLLCVFARRFAKKGVARDVEFRVNTFTTSGQGFPGVASTANGGFVVTWQSTGQEAANYGIYAQRYNAVGLPLGNEIHVNTFTTDAQNVASVAADADGDFLVAWQSYNQASATSHFDVIAQRYTDLDNNGDTVGPTVAAVTPAGSASALGPSGRVMGPVSGLVVAISEDVSVAGGAAGVASATNPANYHLTRGGADVGPFIGGITCGYDASSNRFEAAVTFTTPLTDGLYALTVRNALSDLAGNRLDGRGDGSGFATDFTIGFTVAAVPAAGPETRVNTFTSGSQVLASVAADVDGDYVVTWASYVQDGDQGGIYAQRYDAAGDLSGPEFRVNTFTTNSEVDPAVAMDASGDFVVAWTSQGNQDGSGFGIFAQRYNAGGAPLGGEFPVNVVTFLNQWKPAVAMDAAGDFVIVWQSNLEDANGYGVYARRYNAAGVALSGDIRVNTFTTGDQTEPAVAMDALGGFVVTWTSAGQDGAGDGVFAQRFDSGGLPLGGEFRVNVTTAGTQDTPAVAMNAAGAFIVAWRADNGLGVGYDVYARVYNPAGAALGGEVRANTFTTNNQAAPAVGMDANGEFVVVWQSTGQDGNSDGVYAQRFNPGPSGPEFRVNTFTNSIERNPAVAMDAAGDFIAAWDGYMSTLR